MPAKLEFSLVSLAFALAGCGSRSLMVGRDAGTARDSAALPDRVDGALASFCSGDSAHMMVKASSPIPLSRGGCFRWTAVTRACSPSRPIPLPSKSPSGGNASREAFGIPRRSTYPIPGATGHCGWSPAAIRCCPAAPRARRRLHDRARGTAGHRSRRLADRHESVPARGRARRQFAPQHPHPRSLRPAHPDDLLALPFTLACAAYDRRTCAGP
jgi:hypothetical protein